MLILTSCLFVVHNGPDFYNKMFAVWLHNTPSVLFRALQMGLCHNMGYNLVNTATLVCLKEYLSVQLKPIILRDLQGVTERCSAKSGT